MMRIRWSAVVPSFLGGTALFWIGFAEGRCYSPAKAEPQHDADSAHVEGAQSLTAPREVQTNIRTPHEVVTGTKVFEAGDCTVWRFQDSVGVHYLAEGRSTGFTPSTHAQGALACSVSR